jgi:hypothetical protein
LNTHKNQVRPTRYARAVSLQIILLYYHLFGRNYRADLFPSLLNFHAKLPEEDFITTILQKFNLV